MTFCANNSQIQTHDWLMVDKTCLTSLLIVASCIQSIQQETQINILYKCHCKHILDRRRSIAVATSECSVNRFGNMAAEA